MSKLILEIDGMSCSNCVRHVEAALLDVDGVDVLEVEDESFELKKVA